MKNQISLLIRALGKDAAILFGAALSHSAPFFLLAPTILRNLWLGGHVLKHKHEAEHYYVLLKGEALWEEVSFVQYWFSYLTAAVFVIGVVLAALYALWMWFSRGSAAEKK